MWIGRNNLVDCYSLVILDLESDAPHCKRNQI